MTDFPSIFITHGSPTLPLDDCAARDFMTDLGSLVPRPEAILCVSAHWERARPAVSSATAPTTIHDFYGFPEALYALQYRAPGAPALAQRTRDLLNDAGLECDLDPQQGLDHGAWAPLRLAYPEADIPVAQLSVQTPLGAAHHLALGRALEPLRREGVLILASGSATHNLREFHRHGLNAEPVNYAQEFAVWLDDAVTAGDADALVDYETRGPHASRNHPSPEHFLPLLVAAGAGGFNATGRRLHDSYTYGVFYMGAYAFS